LLLFACFTVRELIAHAGQAWCAAMSRRAAQCATSGRRRYYMCIQSIYTLSLTC